MQTHQLFDQKSDIYQQSRPRYPDGLYAFLQDLVGGDGNVWDVACGNGQASVDLANYFQSVKASDVSPNQIQHAIQAENVDYSVQQAERTQFEHNQFDLVCVAQALHWFDYDLFWPEVQRVLAPGGHFAAWNYNWFDTEPSVLSCIEKTIMKPIEPFWHARNRLAWDNFNAVPFPFSQINTPKFKIVLEWDLSQLFHFIHSWSAVRACMQEKGEGFFQAGWEQTQRAWGDPKSRKKIDMALFFYVGKWQP